MCGIVGVIGGRPAAPLLLDALRRLEYRGYDSAGIATLVAAGSSGGGHRASCTIWPSGSRPSPWAA